jgi:hypothetical protein
MILATMDYKTRIEKTDDEILDGLEEPDKPKIEPPLNVDTTVFMKKDTTPYKGKWVDVN